MIKTHKLPKLPSAKLAALAIVALAMVGGGTWYATRDETPRTDPSAETINLEGPTGEDKKNVEENKQRIVDQDKESAGSNGESAQEPTQQSRAASVTITYAGQYGDSIEIGSYVTNVLEDGGTCTLTLTKDSQRITDDVEGVQDASRTSCPVFTIARSRLSAGTWKAVVSYSSSTASGESSEKTLTVQ